MKDNVVQQKSYAFALRIIKKYMAIRDQGEYVLSKQLLRSGTSIGANIEEALAGQSRKDFVAKMSIASKEAREANYWLRLIQDSEICPSIDLAGLTDESNELIKILTAIVKTGQKSNF